MNLPDLSRYMQFVHYSVFGLGYLQNMNFVTQPGVELYKSITSRIYREACQNGGIEETKEWISTYSTTKRAKFRNALTFFYDKLPQRIQVPSGSAPEIYARLLTLLASDRQIEYGELTFFGDTRYHAGGKTVRKLLERAGDRVFRRALAMPVDVQEGPAMNHSCHEMIINHGRCFSTVLISEKSEKLPGADYSTDYHRAQYLAAQLALAERGRCVVSISVKDLEETTLDALDDFFRQVAVKLKSRRRSR